MRRPGAALPALALLAALAALHTEQADAQQRLPVRLMVSNLGQQSNIVAGLHEDMAQSFTTGSGPSILTSVDVAFARSTENFDSKLTVTVNRDGNGRPGGVVATLANPEWVNRQAGTYSFTHLGVPLEADTPYWVVLDGTGLTEGNSSLRLTPSDAEEPGALPGWSIGDTGYRRPLGSWIVTNNSLALLIGVNGRLAPNADGSYTVPFDWPLKPPGVGGDGTFRLLFITDSWRNAVPSNIGDYDTHVQDAARSGHAAIQPYADQFRVVGSTAAVDAREHTRTDPDNAGHPDAPIYWLNGQRVARNNAGFWSSTWENWAETDRRFESGEVDNESDWPWTGTRTDGTKHSNPLGHNNVRRGRFWTTSGDTGPIDYNTVPNTQDHALYGISPLFRVESTVNAPPGEQAVLSNLGVADGGTHSVSRHNRAQSFTTGNNGGHYRLNSVDIEFAQVSDSGIGNKLRVQVRADNGGTPGRVLARLSNPTLQLSSADRTYAFAYSGADGSGLRLEPNTTYWVVAIDQFLTINGANAIRATASNAERRQGLRLPDGWSIGDDSSGGATTTSWSTHSEALKIGLNLGAADPFVQFRTCEGTVSGNVCSTGWVIANYTKHDPPPTITLREGGPVVTYQWQAVDPMRRSHFYVVDQVSAIPRGTSGGYMGPGGPDRDRLMCHTGSRSRHNLGDPIVYVELDPDNPLYPRIGYGSTAGHLLDRHDGCPFATQSVYEHETDKWLPVSVAAGQDSDAFDHQTHLVHSPVQQDHGHRSPPNNGYIAFPVAQVPLIIRDDDEWEQTLEFSIDDGATWTSIEDGGLSLAFPNSLNTGLKAHYFWVRLKNDPPADQAKRFSIIARFPGPLLNRGTSEYFRSHRVWFTSPAAGHLHSFGDHEFASAFGSATVSRTPIQVEIHVGDNVVGNVTFEVEGFKLYERNDNQISTETPPKTVRTESFSFDRTLGACVGCQRLPGDLPDPVVERIGDLTATNLSDTGIDLSWQRVVGAEGYQVRWWSTTSPFPGVPAVEAWFGAEPTDPAWNIRHLEPDTEYRAVVYYQDHGATQLSTASPVLRFTTLPAGYPVQAEPTSPVLERVPEVSIAAASGTITEGEDAVFTVSVDPAPDAPLDVKVVVAGPSAGNVVDQSELGERTVNVPTSGSATFTIHTKNDANWGSNGLLGATVDFGEGYRRSKFGSHASVYIASNDAPPPPRVQLKRVADTTATVAWAPQDGVTQYTVGWYDTAGLPVPQEATVSGTEYQITGLDPEARYAVYVMAGARHLGQLRVTALAAGEPARNFAVDFAKPPPDTSGPEVRITGSVGGTEGVPVTFTVAAHPAPAADLPVSVTVATSGDFGYGPLPGSVTIPASGSATVTIATTDDDADEADGSVTLTLNAGSGYTVGTPSSQTVSVIDDDGPAEGRTGYTVDPAVVAQVKDLASQTQHGSAHVNRWNRVLLAFGEHDGTGVTGGAMTAAEAREMADRHSSPVWDQVVTELTALEAAPGQTPPPTPEVSVSGGAGVTEGGDATFTVTASPAPAADLPVSVTVSASGDYGAATGARTVTVPATGSVTLTVGTADDSADEADGSVTAALNAGSGYTVSASRGAATVSVSDDDEPPVIPEVSVSGGAGVTEGGDATFTVTASPAPAADLPVSVTVSASGDFGAATGRRTVTVPATGSVTLTVGTADDSADEADGSVTAALNAGSGYTVSASRGAATVAVSDDDEPPVIPEVSVSGGAGVTEGGDATFTVTASPAPAADLPVSVTVSASGDFGAATGRRTVTVPATGSVTLTVGTADDSADEADGSVTAALNAGSGYTVSASRGAATVAVSDDDEPAPEVEVTVAVDDASAVEGDVLEFRVRLSEAPAGEFRVKWYTAPAYHLLDNRAHLSDYQATEGEMVFGPGVTEMTGEVWLEQDSEDEPDEYFAVEAFLPGSLMEADAVGTMSIIDDD